MASLNKVDI